MVHRVHKIIQNKEKVNKTLNNIRARYNLKNNRTLSDDEKTKILCTYASFEMLAHILAYDIATKNNPGSSSYYILDEDGQTRVYRPIKVLSKDPGLVCFALIPDEMTNDNSRIHVIFRGTDDLPSALRDLDPSSPGHQFFIDERDIFLQQINGHIGNIYKRTGQKVKLSMCGHSLGGGDAQNAAASIIKAIAHNLDDTLNGDINLYDNNQKIPKNVRSNLVHIEEFNIAHLNSVGVTKQTANDCKKDAIFMAKCAVPKDKVKINLHVLRVEHDIIQKVGASSILSDVEPQVAKVDMLYVKSNESGDYKSENFLKLLARMLWQGVMTVMRQVSKAHSSFHFTDVHKNEMDYSTNDNLIGRNKVKQHLNDKAGIESSIVLSFFKAVIRTVLKKGAGL